MSEVSEKVRLLKQLESKTVLCATAMMTYNPSIGRVLKRGGVNQFIIIVWEMIQKTGNIQSRDEFDRWHDEFVGRVKNEIRTTSKGELISYGQAQKPVNVFLKLYIDWANLPNLEIANRLRNHLHVPLDSVVMKYVRSHFPKDFQEFKLTVNPLSSIDKEHYYSWQQCFRRICPEKPLLIDVFWAVKRFRVVFETMMKRGQNA